MDFTCGSLCSWIALICCTFCIGLSDVLFLIASIWNVAGKSELAFVDLKTEKMTPGPALPTELAFSPRFSRDGTQLTLVLNGAAEPSDVGTRHREPPFSPDHAQPPRWRQP